MIHVVFEGRLGRDPEKRVSKSGNEFFYYTVAVDMFNNGESTTWWLSVKDFVTTRRIYSSLKKGSSVFLTGEMNMPVIYDKNDGTKAIDAGVIVSSVNFAMTNTRDSAANGQQPATEQATSTVTQDNTAPVATKSSMNDFQKAKPVAATVETDTEEPLPF